MAIYIRIEKKSEKNDIGYYEVTTEAAGGAHFYIGIDKKNGLINFYTSRDMNIPVEVVDCANKDKPLKGVPNVAVPVFARVVLRALKAFDMDGFPEYLSHEA